MFTSGITPPIVLNSVRSNLTALRAAVEGVRDLYGWSSGVSSADLVALGFTQADADALLSACADANAFASIYETGLPPTSYPQPPSAYPYSASQRQVIGPQ